jgi:iron(III) transport system substrate-binding protein
VATLVSMMGEETAFAYMKRAAPSVREYVASGSQLALKVSAGEAPIAIGFIHDGVRERMKGAPVTVVSPCEGTGYETGSVSIVRGGNLKEARRFVDWVLSAEVQAFAVETRQYQLPSNLNTPIPKGAPRFSDFKIYMAYDPKKFASPDEKRRLTARWEREVLGEAGKR